jgi:murein DD-endopeptidase MepM/ murein hydrolase activator NlpD
VRALQSVLRKLGFDTIVDGDFGPGTEADVRRYESRRGLTVDGRVTPRQAGTMERRARRQGVNPPSSTEPKSYAFGDRSLRRGDRGEDVRTLQELLGTLGFPTGTDGDFGPATEGRVREYETERGMVVDGVVAPRQANSMKRRAAQMPPPPPQAGGTADGVFPIRGPHNYGGPASRFGDDRGTHFHQGQDVFAATGTPLVAAKAGRVVYRQYQASGAGNYVVIRGDDGTDYVYMHMQFPGSVTPGQTVRAGQEIGRVGCTGRCYGSHLHFEMWTARWYDGGRPFDPLPSLRKWDS